MNTEDELKFNKGVYSIQELANDTADLLVGEYLPELEPNRPDKVFICIELDNYFTERFGTKYTAVEIYSRGVESKREIQMTVHGVDDDNFYFIVQESININLSIFIDLMERWFGRFRYRYINLHALEDELRYLFKHESINISWN